MFKRVLIGVIVAMFLFGLVNAILGLTTTEFTTTNSESPQTANYNEPEMLLAPDGQVPDQDGNVHVVVALDPKGSSVQTLETEIAYDSHTLQFISIWPIGYLANSTVDKRSINPNPGTIKFSLHNTEGISTTGASSVAYMTFKPILKVNQPYIKLVRGNVNGRELTNVQAISGTILLDLTNIPITPCPKCADIVPIQISDTPYISGTP